MPIPCIAGTADANLIRDQSPTHGSLYLQKTVLHLARAVALSREHMEIGAGGSVRLGGGA